MNITNYAYQESYCIHKREQGEDYSSKIEPQIISIWNCVIFEVEDRDEVEVSLKRHPLCGLLRLSNNVSLAIPFIFGHPG